MPKFNIEVLVRVDAKDAIEANQLVRAVIEADTAIEEHAIMLTEEQDG